MQINGSYKKKHRQGVIAVARRRVNTTKYEIIRTGTRLFLEKGYSATTPKLICEELDISTGNLTYYFPTKEHLLAVLVEMLCSFQREMLQNTVQEQGRSSVLAVCLELASMAAASEQNEMIKDFFIASYVSPMCLEIVRRNDTLRAKEIYREYCPDWSDLQHIEAETLVSGIEFATLMTTPDSAPLETRLTGALNYILMIYNVPEEIRRQKIRKVLSLDYRKLGGIVLEQFKQFVEETNEHAFEELLKGIGV